MGRLIFYLGMLVYYLLKREGGKRQPLDRRGLWDVGVLILFSALMMFSPPMALPVLVFGLMASADLLARWFALIVYASWAVLSPWVLIAAPAAIAMAMPWAAAGLVVRRGWDRAASFLGERSVTWGEQHEAGATVAAAWALVHRHPLDDEALRRVQARLAQASQVGGAELLASGLIASARGDHDGARRLVASVLKVSDAVCPRAARRLAVEWLDADAAARGEWAEIRARAALPHTRAGRLLLLLAQRDAGGADAPTPTQLWLAWAAAPHRLATRALLRAALARDPASSGSSDKSGAGSSRRGNGSSSSSDAGSAGSSRRGNGSSSSSDDSSAGSSRRGNGSSSSSDDSSAGSSLRGNGSSSPHRSGDAGPAPVDAGDAGDPLAAAIRRHAAALASEHVDGAALAQLALAWDRGLGTTDAKIAASQRAAVLGAPGADAALASMRDAVVSDLVGLARESETALEPLAADAGSSPILADAARRLRNQLLGEIELAFTALADRHGAGRTLPASDEWREFLALCATYEHAARLGGLELRRLAFPHVYLELQAFAVALWNNRHEHVLANAMFRWLRDEARAVGDASAIELLEQNCSVPI